MKRQDIAIVGAGITALTLALKLAGQKHKVTIFEKEDQVGGLASGFLISGADIEKTYHHIFQNDSYFINLAKEIGVEIGWYESKMSILHKNTFYPFSTPLDLIKFDAISLFSRIQTGLTTLFLQKYKNWQKLEHIKAQDWIRKYYGWESSKAIWQPLLQSKFGRYCQDISMAWFWARMNVRSNSRKGIFSKEYLGYPRGGFTKFISKLSSELVKLGVQINLKCQIEGISQNKEQRIVLKTKTFLQTFDKVVVTIPSPIFARILDEKTVSTGYIKKLNQISYLGSICMVFSSTQDLSNSYWHNLNDPKLPFLVFVNHTKLIDKANYNHRNIYYLGGYYEKDHRFFKMNKSDIENEWLKALKEIIPNLDLKKIEESFIFKSAYAQHVVDTNYKSKIPDYQTPISNLYLANFSQIYPEDRGVNYAIREAEKIYRIINNLNDSDK
jgi:protoporphyrinogen oxidase